MVEMTMGKALTAGLRQAMLDDPKVVLMGEDIGKLGGVFRVTEGLQAEFGEKRVIDSPLAESAIVGTAIGLAIILKLAHVDNLAMGLVVTFQIWFFIVLSTRLYSFVYSPERPGLLVMDAIHLLLGTMAAGAIISAWP